MFVQLTHKAGMTKKRAAPVETGTTQKREVDFEWIPREIVKAGQWTFLPYFLVYEDLLADPDLCDKLINNSVVSLVS